MLVAKRPSPFALVLFTGQLAALSACGTSTAAEPATSAAPGGVSSIPAGSSGAGANAAAASSGTSAAGRAAAGTPASPTSTNTTPASSTVAAGAGAPAPTSAGTGGRAGATANTAGTAGLAASSGSSGGPAAGSSAGAPAATSGTCPGTLCESFESMTGPMLDGAWAVAASNCMGTGMVSVDSTQAHSGMRSIHVQGAGGYCNHAFFGPKDAKLPMNAPVFLRFFVRLGKALTQSHVTFLAMRDEHEMKDLRMGGQSEILMWNRESDDATLPELSPTGIGMSLKPETGKWLCVEVAIDPQASSLQTFVDGKQLQGLTVEGDPTPDVDAQWKRKTDWKPDLRDVRFGWESYGSDANDLWFDDIAIGGARLGCGT